jgi:hypothetical protein
MTELRVAGWTMPAADLGRDNPLPPLWSGVMPKLGEPSPDVPYDDQRYLGWGCEAAILPYAVQDGYDRAKRPRRFLAVVLENEHLRATFLPELGGRLWSLVAKPEGRELLYANPVWQPANLAVRNAWFSGGVEWNASIPGHTPLTCSPLFAATLARPDGTPVLRQYEWERRRGVCYQLDAWLPAGSPVLLIAVRQINPNPVEVPGYWWSNIAVAESPTLRVLAPAEAAYENTYTGGLTSVGIPQRGERDISYPASAPGAADWFFRLPDGRQPWIAALEADGAGLFQTSTPRLRGRKLFVWGQGVGGRRWQEFLSVPDRPYLEIQAGLARTQGQCLPFPAGAQWCWVEAYGRLQTDPAVTHGADWSAAWQAAAAGVAATISSEALAEAEIEALAGFDQPPTEHLHLGSGWGALERRRRTADHEPPPAPPGLPFPSASLGPEQEPWLALLDLGRLPQADPSQPPAAFMTHPAWRRRLNAGGDSHWLAWLHRGLMAFDAGETEAAADAWRLSLAAADSAWARRNLAVLADDPDGLAAALALAPDEVRLAVETAQALLRAGRAADWLAILDSLPPAVAEHGRVRLLTARAALEAGDPDRCQALLLGGLVVPDVREGEVALSDLWQRLVEQRALRDEGGELTEERRAQLKRECPPPPELDFRMS